MNIFILLGVAVAAAYYLTKGKEATVGGRLPVGEVEIPADADPDTITLQDVINLVEAWILQAAGDVSAMEIGLAPPGDPPAVDWFGGLCPYSGRIDPATRLHLTRIKAVLNKTHLPLGTYDQLGLVTLIQTDVTTETNAPWLVDALLPLESHLMAIGVGYPAVDDTNRALWALYTSVGQAYYVAAGLT